MKAEHNVDNRKVSLSYRINSYPSTFLPYNEAVGSVFFEGSGG